MFRVDNPAAVAQEISWSTDGTALLDFRDSLGTLRLDSETGRPFATLGLSKPGALGASESVSPDLRRRVSRGDAAWELVELPPPDDAPPRASLARAMADAGLEMRGIELVYGGP